VSVVLDSGIWISGFHFGGIPLLALDRAFVSDRIVICPEIRLEISAVLVEKFGWKGADVNAALATYLADAKNVELKGTVKAVCRDPKDDMLFECACSAVPISSCPGIMTCSMSGATKAYASFLPANICRNHREFPVRRFGLFVSHLMTGSYRGSLPRNLYSRRNNSTMAGLVTFPMALRGNASSVINRDGTL